MDPLSRGNQAIAHGVPQIPKEEWTSHPRFPSQTLLLGSHRNFRQISRSLVQAAKDGDDARSIRRLFSYWHSGMRGHEHYEESKLFPYLSRRYGVSLDVLKDGHAALHQLREQVFAALDRQEKAQRSSATNIQKAESSEKTAETERAEATEGTEATTQLVEALEAYDTLLHDHLAEEEGHVIPMLLSLSPEEFESYTQLPIGILLKKLQG